MRGIKKFIFEQPLWRKIAGGIVLFVILYFTFGRSKHTDAGITFAARRGRLEINVLQGGSLEALESQAIKCEVKGYNGIKILKIVEEGYQVTEDDVKTNKVLVELDSSEIQNKITQEDINYESNLAALTDARQAYEIQVNQNLSDINASLQKVRFARMDFDKSMSAETTGGIINQLGLDDDLAETNVVKVATAMESASTPHAALGGGAADGAASAEEKAVMADAKASNAIQKAMLKTADPADEAEATLKQVADSQAQVQPKPIAIDFSKYARLELLGDGEMKQKMRKNEDDLQVAQKEMSQAKTALEGTQRLFAKGFVTKTELEGDEFKYENSRLKVQTAETARNLFLRYEFPKTCEEALSKYAEAVRELDRTKKGAISKQAQAEAKLKSAEGRYKLELRQRDELQKQLQKCTIKASKTGLVVYGGGNMNAYYYGGDEQIREGALVREQQPIITIPDMSKMAVKVRILETYIKKIKKGQQVRITVEAFPDKLLMGEISKVGVLPDSQNMWMNPDMKVYLTTITIKETQDWIKPGMSAKAEILIKELPDVVYVPIQAVNTEGNKQICYLAHGSRQERHEIETGEFNDEFIEVKNGIKEGDKVCLRSPEDSGSKDKKNEEPAEKKKENAAPDAGKKTK
ncbi:MAG: Efflux transporter, family, subunit [Pedosphaera sp.]|nr:Efflux transporter, family, subunit [Pedosphaera sp.]